ncbi:MAG: prolyl aminopeptidase [Rhodospirillales bacterium]|nr:prolyl aminopeptidase [Alphaproteobacteria bacterium]USO03118.1 MAG: prolyl aminopeptidase [Rhodospirillales bacterium]
MARKTAYPDLFPHLTPYSTGFLDLSHGHQMYWEQSGNPDGVPVLFLHGGPGAGCAPVHRQFFDPEAYRIILYDQRGAGRSTPHGSLEHNTRVHLIRDIKQLQTHLSVERWHVFGGSWGSTLALSYAAAFPEDCISLILRGIYLLEKEENDWWLYGARALFPEAWEQFAGFIPEEEQGDLLEAYYKRLTGPDPDTQMEAAISWALYESACSSLIPNYETITTEEQKAHALSLARIECHYFRNEQIAAENSLLKAVEKFRHIPSVIIHGRYDAVCPIVTAHKLHLAWPEADYIVVPDGGHSALDPAIRSRLIQATEHAKTIS